MNLCLQYYNAATGDVYAVPLNDEHRQLLHRYAVLTDHEQTFLSSYDEAITRCLSPKVIILTNDPDELISTAKERFPPELFHIIKGSPHPYFVEFISPGINKGSSVEKIFKHYGVPIDQVVSFGDGDNDSEMLQLSGLGVAVKNAKDMAKASANIVSEVS